MATHATSPPQTAKDNLDIQAQIDDLRQLEDAWLDGDGLAPSPEGLDWLAKQFAIEYPDADLPLPYIFPTPEGGVLAEWFIGSNSASLEANFNDRSAYWHNLNLQTRKDEERTLDLQESSDWAWFKARLLALVETD